MNTLSPAGPTTATRMDKVVGTLLATTGLLAMIGNPRCVCYQKN